MKTLENKLVIFDCDGVLVDSEVIACSLRVGQLQKLGIDVSLEDFISNFVGSTSGASASLLQQYFKDKDLPHDYHSSHQKN